MLSLLMSYQSLPTSELHLISLFAASVGPKSKGKRQILQPI